MKKKEKPKDPRQKVRIYRNGLHLLKEFYIDPGQQTIDVDIYYSTPEPELTVHANRPQETVKES